MKKLRKTHISFFFKKIKCTEKAKELINLIPKQNSEFKKSLRYKPIHPHFPFNRSSISIDEMVKKNNLSLITNNNLRNIIIKFREIKKKASEERKIIFKKVTENDFEKEKNNHFLMLRAMLRKDPLTIQSLIKREQENSKKLNSIETKKSKSCMNRTSPLTNLFYKKKTQKKVLLGRISFTPKKEIWEKEVLENFKKKYEKKEEYKIKSIFMVNTPGKHAFNKTTINIRKKFNQCISFSNLNMYSNKLGRISLFGIFEGNGPSGRLISLIVKDYIINYFKNSTEMKVNLNKDNFYSIMYHSFEHAQNFLINNAQRFNINLNYSGTCGCIVLYPHNHSNKIFCANLGRNKCIFFTMSGNIRLTFELYPERASERFRISQFLKTRKKAEEKKEEKKIKNNKANNNENDESKNDNNEKPIAKFEEKERELYLKDFEELNISRCLGNLIAEDRGVIPGPEVVESDVKANRGKYLVMGNPSFWKYLTEEEVGYTVNKYLSTSDSVNACKDLEELAKEKWKINKGSHDDLSIIVVYFDMKNI